LKWLVYRYGFNGKEKDDEVKGAGASYDFGARMYDPRLGRWLSCDPLFAKYRDLSPFNYCDNNPIMLIDNDGKKITFPIAEQREAFLKRINDKVTGAGVFGINEQGELV
jgi:RHS repeat-associated protein